MTNINPNEYLEYPREFRLLEELKNSDGYINFGTNDINLEKFDVNLLSDKTFTSTNFTMIIPLSYPTEQPNIDDLYSKINNVQKQKILNIKWNNNSTIKSYLKEIYNLI
jgi:hypothetical protein